MSTYEIVLLWAVVLLIASVLAGFTAVTNRRPIGAAMVLFVMGGLALFYANNLSLDGNLAEDIPDTIYKLYARIMN